MIFEMYISIFLTTSSDVLSNFLFIEAPRVHDSLMWKASKDQNENIIDIFIKWVFLKKMLKSLLNKKIKQLGIERYKLKQNEQKQ